MAGNWNRTYEHVEPQQVHLTWLSEGSAIRVQFVTTDKIDQAQLVYWPVHKKTKRNTEIITVSGDECTPFVDGGAAKRLMHIHSLKSNDLSKGTVYEYKVGSIHNGTTTVWSPVYQFHTPDTTPEFKFVAAADMGVVNAVSMPILKTIAKEQKYDFMTFMGDQAYDLADMNGTKGDEYMNFAQDVYARLPLMTTPGNHESAYNFSHYLNRFSHLPYQESASPSPLLYSLDYKSLHLVSISTEAFFEQDGTEVDQVHTLVNWLEQDLDKHQQKWVVVIGHRPLYCSPADDKDCTYKADTLRNGIVSKQDNKTRLTPGLEEVFVKHKIDLYLCGHRHNYERSYPMANNQALSKVYHNPPSFYQVISGNAGNFDGPDPVDEAAPRADWSAVLYRGYGFTTVEVAPEALELVHWESKQDGTIGREIDRVRLTKDA
ncbi:Metallo-dependent phosphatase-like protein [Zychaea mexicana]|uniref:Metallo-dependent phosphatase-like protein n=1 Tax=Zychaea mexicana TaxID=64656 RepID=UPI0022FF3A2E|nr:Metallo-dependent phosphatase-like protein [Zychaea mexicana]KAI9495565.1 Metallo-dependent phosphatase-like protein [Zychaea mexicana]